MLVLFKSFCQIICSPWLSYMGLVASKASLGFENSTGTDQPAHSRSLISTFVIHFWKKKSNVNMLVVKFQFSRLSL